MSTAANHRNRSHRSYYIRNGATTGHAKQTLFITQSDAFLRRQRLEGFFGRLFRGRKREAET